MQGHLHNHHHQNNHSHHRSHHHHNIKNSQAREHARSAAKGDYWVVKQQAAPWEVGSAQQQQKPHYTQPHCARDWVTPTDTKPHPNSTRPKCEEHTRGRVMVGGCESARGGGVWCRQRADTTHGNERSPTIGPTPQSNHLPPPPPRMPHAPTQNPKLKERPRTKAMVNRIRGTWASCRQGNAARGDPET
jgi:hypothetical protein